MTYFCGMAYNRRNHLERVLVVQQIYNAKKREGHFTTHIWREWIYPAYRISFSTFYNYLATPAERDLKKLKEPKPVPTLFN